ncbi:MAG: hypothetical protein KDK41_06655 [Leptospiraceae bacterium]|nr:hypothetical protein [Leptospiraceae bacterium]MCB1200308.1 hypothetical protein [Leptospiraceae bacterium]
MSAPLFSEDIEGDGWRFKSQFGLWFGPVTPVPGSALSNVLSTNIGGGTFIRMNIPSDDWLFETGLSYSYYTSNGPARLHAVPVYGAMNYRLPINLPLTFFAKAGAGATYVSAVPEDKENWHPTALLGLETSFPAGKWVNIGVRLDYYFVYEDYLTPPANVPNYQIANGHLFNFGLMVNFNVFR